MIIIAFVAFGILFGFGIFRLNGRVILGEDGKKRPLTLGTAGERIIMPAAGTGLAFTFWVWTIAFGLNLNNQAAVHSPTFDDFQIPEEPESAAAVATSANHP